MVFWRKGITRESEIGPRCGKKRTRRQRKPQNSKVADGGQKPLLDWQWQHDLPLEDKRNTSLTRAGRGVSGCETQYIGLGDEETLAAGHCGYRYLDQCRRGRKGTFSIFSCIRRQTCFPRFRRLSPGWETWRQWSSYPLPPTAIVANDKGWIELKSGGGPMKAKTINVQ